MPSDIPDPRAVAQFLSDNAQHAALGAVGVGAALLRLATYTGPARPWRVVILDGCVMLTVAYGVAALALGLSGSPYVAIGTGLASGLVGWEAVKRAAAARMKRGS